MDQSLVCTGDVIVKSLRESNARGWGACVGSLAILLCLFACSRDVSLEVKPGESGYPEENLHPTQIVQITAILPRTLSVMVRAGYSVSSNYPACQRRVGLAVSAPIGLNIPIQLSGSGESYRGTVVVDQFEPGMCGWQFAGVGFTSEKPSSEGALIARYDGRKDDPQGYTLDIWCKNAARQNPQRPEFCFSLKFLETFPGLIAPDLVASVPERERDNAGPARIGPNTRSITVLFHDLDAISGSDSSRR
jgi:hypothetical protein